MRTSPPHIFVYFVSVRRLPLARQALAPPASLAHWVLAPLTPLACQAALTLLQAIILLPATLLHPVHPLPVAAPASVARVAAPAPAPAPAARVAAPAPAAVAGGSNVVLRLVRPHPKTK
jgi:hypothetical protein